MVNLYIVTAGKILESLCTADILVFVDITNRGSTDISALLKLGFLPARVPTFCLQQSLKAVFQTTHFSERKQSR